MKVIIITNKTMLVRHWGRWYRVMRGGADWHRLEIAARQTPFSLAKVSEDLQKKYGAAEVPTYVDELLKEKAKVNNKRGSKSEKSNSKADK